MKRNDKALSSCGRCFHWQTFFHPLCLFFFLFLLLPLLLYINLCMTPVTRELWIVCDRYVWLQMHACVEEWLMFSKVRLSVCVQKMGGGWGVAGVCVCERVRVTQSPPRRGSHVGCHSTGHWAPPAAPVISLACQPFDGKADTHTYLRHSSHGQAPGKTVIRSSVNASSGDSWGLKFKENSKHKEQFASSIISQANKEPFAACPGLMCCIGWQLESTVASHAAILLSLPLSHWHTDTVTKASF